MKICPLIALNSLKAGQDIQISRNGNIEMLPYPWYCAEGDCEFWIGNEWHCCSIKALAVSLNSIAEREL